MTDRGSENEKRLLLSSKEMAKAVISYNRGKMNLVHRDLLSAGVNFYYSLFHSCLSVIASTTTAIPVDRCVAEFGHDQLPRFYVPITHKDLKRRIGEFDSELADELDRLMPIREYLSYGPNLLYEKTDGKVRIDLYTKKFPRLRSGIRRSSQTLPTMIGKCCQLLKTQLDPANFSRFLIYFYMATEMICKDLSIGQDQVKKCSDALSSFDEDGKIREFYSKLRIHREKRKS